MIHGIGTDIVNITRFRAAIERWGERFTHRLFTERERAYCQSKKYPWQHMAVRFAAKEAFIKAMGRPFSFKDIEIQRDESGRPVLSVNGFSKKDSLPDYHFSVSLSHEREFGVAQVVVERFSVK